MPQRVARVRDGQKQGGNPARVDPKTAARTPQTTEVEEARILTKTIDVGREVAWKRVMSVQEDRGAAQRRRKPAPSVSKERWLGRDEAHRRIISARSVAVLPLWVLVVLLTTAADPIRRILRRRLAELRAQRVREIDLAAITKIE